MAFIFKRKNDTIKHEPKRLKKNTKRALLTGILSVVLCMAMLIGSTFAWFTDEVKTGNNRIVAGNLDIDLQKADSCFCCKQKQQGL